MDSQKVSSPNFFSCHIVEQRGGTYMPLKISFQPIQLLFLAGVACFLLDAVRYSFQTRTGMRMALKTLQNSGAQRFLLLLVFANMALYVLTLFALLGAYLMGPAPKAAHLVLLLSLFASLGYTLCALFLTPADWRLTFPRMAGAFLIAIGLVMAFT
jgi:hypothetical protein